MSVVVVLNSLQIEFNHAKIGVNDFKLLDQM